MVRRLFVAAVVLVALLGVTFPAYAHHHHHHRKHHHHHSSSESGGKSSGHKSSSGDDSSGDTSDSSNDSSSSGDGSTGQATGGTTADTSGDTSTDTPAAGAGDTPAAMGKIPTGTPQTIQAELSGFSWQDNTPPGSSTISMGVLHKVAAGTGTFADPITTAVPGHAPNVETPKGTRLYVAKLKRYFIVEDSGATKEGTRHFDLWVGGQGFSKSQSDKCESSYTGKLPVILNPPAGEPVTPGQLTGANGCNV